MKHNEEYKGKANLLIRAYFYIKSGLNVLNDFKYLVAGIFAVVITYKMTNPLILVAMFLVGLPVLFIMGYVNTHYISKVVEWLSIKYGSHYGIKQYELMEKQTKLLEKLLKKLK